MLKSPVNEALRPIHHLETEAAKENEIAQKPHTAALDAYNLGGNDALFSALDTCRPDLFCISQLVAKWPKSSGATRCY
jgi:hypothetical protein